MRRSPGPVEVPLVARHAGGRLPPIDLVRVALLAGDRLVGAITLTLPKERFHAGLAGQVRAAALALSAQLGGHFETAQPAAL